MVHTGAGDAAGSPRGAAGLGAFDVGASQGRNGKAQQRRKRAGFYLANLKPTFIFRKNLDKNIARTFPENSPAFFCRQKRDVL